MRHVKEISRPYHEQCEQQRRRAFAPVPSLWATEILSAPRRSIHNRARTNMGAVENLASSIKPSSNPSPTCLFHVGSRRQRTRAQAAAKINSVAAPSVVAIEKCAISEGEKANRASAKFAAVRENKRLRPAIPARPTPDPAEHSWRGPATPEIPDRGDASDAK